jgi:hypothetical protein
MKNPKGDLFSYPPNSQVGGHLASPPPSHIPLLTTPIHISTDNTIFIYFDLLSLFGQQKHPRSEKRCIAPDLANS